MQLIYKMPLNEMVFDFFDRLKSATKGYASMDYELTDYRGVRSREARHPDQRRAGRCAFLIIHRDKAGLPRAGARRRSERVIDRQMFEVAIQAAIGTKVVARETHHGASQERDRQVLRRRHQP